MPVAFVMPCLNEAAMLEAAAASLGFGPSAAPAEEEVYLVLVDNGSTDGTLEVMARIAAGSRPGSVAILEEPERGFVPPRRRGALHVEELASRFGGVADQWLVLQADADTRYLPGYARWMHRFSGGRTGILLEGAVKRDEAFDEAYPAYRALERSVDASLEEASVSDEDEVVVDDKTCGYLLSDYLRWGGHFREYDSRGDEVHAETSRLLLRARLAHGAAKVRVNPAQAVPSRRRIVEDPALHFATAGFPREEGWLIQWRVRHPRRRTIEEFAADPADPEVVEAAFYRRAHEIVLFWVLPWALKRARDAGSTAKADPQMKALLECVPATSADEVARSPASLLMGVLDLIDRRPELFEGPVGRTAINGTGSTI